MVNEEKEYKSLYFTAPEAEEKLGVTRNTLYTWLKNGTIKGRKLGNKWLIPKKEVLPNKEEGE